MVQRIFEITNKNRTTSKFYYQRQGLLLVLSGKHSVFSNGMQWLKYFPTWGTFPISQLRRSKLVWVMPDAQKQTCLSDAMARKRLILGLIIVQKAGNSKKNDYLPINITKYLEDSKISRIFAPKISTIN